METRYTLTRYVFTWDVRICNKPPSLEKKKFFFILHPEVYILIIPGFGIISTTISANSNKSVFGYIGMVKIRPTLNNIYVNLLYMLGTYKTLNTSNIYFYSNNFKDITMSNQQVAKNNIHIFILLNRMHLWRYVCLFGNLRDYTRRVILTGWLRYSPVFS